jgi:hypothetical protein
MITLSLNIPEQSGRKFYTKQRPLQGVTRVLNEVLFPDFDSVEVARRMCKNDIVKMSVLLCDWKYKGDVARHEGTLLHKMAENFCSGKEVSPTTNRETLLLEYLKDTIGDIYSYDELYSELPVYKERLTVELGGTTYTFTDVVGIPDLVTAKNGKITIYDFKRTSGDISKAYGYLKDNVTPDSKLNRYHFQLLMYKAILGAECDLVIVSVDEDKVTVYKF